MRYFIFQSNFNNLTQAKNKIDSSFQLMIAYDMLYYVKLTALSIKTISRTLTLLVLKIAISSLVKDAIIKFSVIIERKPQYESGKDIYLSL